MLISQTDVCHRDSVYNKLFVIYKFIIVYYKMI